MIESDNRGAQKVYPRLLSDDPSGVDAFTGKSHERIARTLVRLLRDVEPKHRAIGLEGGWGSGKSTVIEIAKALLMKEPGAGPQYKVFCFDAWAHHGDDFKRAFLEELITWLESEKALRSSEAEDLREDLRANKRETTTRTKPKLSWAGAALAAVAPLLPLAYLWLGPAGFYPEKQFGVMFLGLDVPRIVLLTLLTALLLVPYAVVGLRLVSKKGDIAAAFGLLIKHEETEETTQTIRDTDPTAVEFNAFLDRVIATSDADKDRMLVVVDNIDRLPANRMAEYWAELRNLIALGGENWRRVRIIVPYAPEHVIVGSGTDAESDQALRKLRDGALQKIFQARITVAPPMISHWKKFLDEKLDEALGEGILTENIRYRLSKLYEYRLSTGEVAATPRDIISFVNRIASLVLQWEDTIPVDCAALFVVFQDEITDPTEHLGKGTLLPAATKLLFETMPWQRYLAALHFNVLPEDADQVLLGVEITRLLTEGDAAGLETLRANPGFYHVLDRIIAEEAVTWARQAPPKFSVVTSTLLEIQNDSPHFDPWFRQLADAGMELGDTPTLDVGAVERISRLLGVADSSRAALLASKLVRWIDDFAQRDNKCDGGSWLRSLNVIIGASKRIAGAEPNEQITALASRFVPGDAGFVIEAAEASSECEHVNFARLAPRAKTSEITALLVDRISNRAPVNLAAIVTVLTRNSRFLLQADVLMAASDRLSSNTPPLSVADASELYFTIEHLDPQWKSEFADKVLASGALLHWVKAGLEAKEWKLAASAFWRLDLSQGDAVVNPGRYGTIDLSEAASFYSTLRSTGDAPDGYWSQLSEVVEHKSGFQHCFDKAVTEEGGPAWSRALLSRLIERGRFNRLGVERVLKQFPLLARLLGPELTERFVVKFGEWEQRYEAALADEKLYECSREIIQYALRPEGSAIGRIAEIVKERLRGYDAEIWTEALDTRSDDIRLLLLVLRAGKFELPAPAFREPLLNHMIRILEGTDAAGTEPDWSLLLDALMPDTRSKLFDDLVRRAGTVTSYGGIIRFLEVFPVVLNEAPLDRYPDAAVNALFIPALEADNDQTTVLMSHHVKMLKTCVESAKPSVRGAFLDSLQALADNARALPDAPVHEVARAFGIAFREAASDAATEESAKE